MNEKNQIIFWNEAAEKLLGYTAEEAAGKLCYEILGGRDEQGRTLCQRYCRIAVRAAQGETLPNLDVLAKTNNGQERWLNLTTLAVPTGDAEMGKVIVHLFRDATEHKGNERFISHILEAARELRLETDAYGVPMPAPEPVSDPLLDTLTPRETEVLRLLAQGVGTEEMADMLSISEATTRNHVQNVLSKLGVHSRLEAVVYAYQRGLVEVGD